MKTTLGWCGVIESAPFLMQIQLLSDCKKGETKVGVGIRAANGHFRGISLFSPSLVGECESLVIFYQLTMS